MNRFLSFSFCFSILLFPRHWWHEIQDVRFRQSWASCLQQFYPILHPVCGDGFRTISSWSHWTRPTSLRESLNILSKFESIRNTIFLFPRFVQSMSLYIDVKMILPLMNCSGTHSSFWMSPRIPNVVNPGKTFHSNSVGSPSIRPKSLRWRVSEKHFILLSSMLGLVQYWYLPDIALSQKRRRFWQSQIEQLCQLTE